MLQDECWSLTMMRTLLLFSIMVKGCSLMDGCRNRKTTLAVGVAKQIKKTT